MKRAFIILFMLISTFTFATHNIGGYIAMKHVTGFTYKIKFVSITNVGPQIQADRCTITVNFSDGDSVILNRVNGAAGACPAPATMGLVVANGIKYNVYEGFKTFATQGTFKAWAIDPNRNDGIINIPNSVNVPFYCETFLTVLDPLIYCPVSTVDFGNFPLFKAVVNNSFKTDLPLADTQGDSISYRMDTCKTSFGNNILGYSIPQGVAVNPTNGKFTISAQQVQGQLGFALRASKWRNGVMVSYSILDFGMNISSTPINNVQLPINSNLTLNSDSIYIANFAITDTVKIDYTTSASYQINLYSEIDNNLISQTNVGNNTSLRIANLALLERKQPYKLTIRANDSPMTTNAAKDYIFYFTIGNNNATQCTLPQDLGGKELKKPELISYPNPVLDDFFILNLPEKSNIKIYSLQGQLLKTNNVNEASVNVSNLQQGIYFYAVTDASGNEIGKGKLVKK